MIVEILQHTPSWVFVLFVVLLYFGYLQSKTRTVSRGRLAVLPMAMVGLSLYGILSDFDAIMIGLIAWTLGFASAIFLNKILRHPRGVIYADSARLFTVPGSWIPLTLMMGIYFSKYAIAVALFKDASLGGLPAFVSVASFIYGILSGTFFARSLQIYRAAQQNRLHPDGSKLNVG